MAFIWRRRSTSIVKIVAILTAIWFFIAFLIYTDETRRDAGNSVGLANKFNSMALSLKSVAGAGGAAEDDTRGFENGAGYGVNGDAIVGDGGVGVGKRAAENVIPIAEPDVPPIDERPVQKVDAAAVVDDAADADANVHINDINEGVESVLNNVVVHPVEKQKSKSKQKKKPPQQQKPQQKPDDDQNVLDAPGVVEPVADNSPGEMGKPVKLSEDMPEDMKKAVDDGWTKNAFNQYASDLISVHRSLPDPRDTWCKEPGRYLEDLPKTDVIICFHNEAWSVLLRTVHSVLDRSPEHLIGNIILVDDYSDMPHLKKQLEDYMAQVPKVKIVRGPKREGLIRARLQGARYATSPVITYLDSHCECTEGWLEPLLDRIARNSTTVVCPVIDVIDDTTMEYHYRDSTSVNVGGFDWNLQFSWHPVPDREKARHNNTAEPVYSPTMAGGLFSIDRLFFERLGTYDSGFDIWGGENLELSFKTWMCSGTLEIVPCSHVGHIFRKRSPYKWRSGINVLKKNSVRLAEVWLDDYAKYYYDRIGHDKGDFGDVSERKQLRNDLECKSFKWYLDTIYPELFIPGDSVASGEIRNLGYGGRTCLDSPTRKRDIKKAAGLYPCHRQGGNQIASIPTNMCIDSPLKFDNEVSVQVYECHGQRGNQFWMYSKAGEIRRDEVCLDYAGHDVMIFPCHGSKGNQFWKYKEETKQIHHGSSDKCLAINEKKDKLVMEECNASYLHQQWSMENYDPTKL